MNMLKPFQIALLQLAVTANKATNLANAKNHVLDAAKRGARMVVLPECWNSPYGTQYFAQYAEKIPSGESCQAMSSFAREAGIYLIGGSIPEDAQDGSNKFYNTCTIWSPKGELIDVHRKVHLFDIDVPGKITFQESKVLSPGEKITVVDTELGRIGVGICYDVRFPELAMAMARKGAQLLIYPGAFNMTTGPLHWELLARARAVDNQVYVAMCAPARDKSASYHSWGHSLVVAPRGEVLAAAEACATTITAAIEPQPLDDFRAHIPLVTQRRFDLYRNVLMDSTTPE